MEAVSKNDRHSKVNHRNRIIREFWYAFKSVENKTPFLHCMEFIYVKCSWHLRGLGIE